MSDSLLFKLESVLFSLQTKKCREMTSKNFDIVNPRISASTFKTFCQSRLILTCFVILLGLFGIIVDTFLAIRLLYPSYKPLKILFVLYVSTKRSIFQPVCYPRAELLSGKRRMRFIR